MLNKNGAEIYLITSTKSNRLKKINKKSKKYNQIYLKEMYSSMTKGVEFREDFKSSNNYKLKLIIKLLINLVSPAFSGFVITSKNGIIKSTILSGLVKLIQLHQKEIALNDNM